MMKNNFTWGDMELCKKCYYADKDPCICLASGEKPDKMIFSEDCSKYLPESKWKHMNENMQNKSKRDTLIKEYQELMKKARECADESEKNILLKKASDKHDEILMNDMGRDKNFKRFS